MKIIGFVSIDGHIEMVLKCDSCLLNNRKPFFVPDWTTDLRYTPCVVLRVSRLGKHIAPKFSGRYYDAVAAGADFVAQDVLDHAREVGMSWTPAMAFDYSLALGSWLTDVSTIRPDDMVLPPSEAISRASAVMTIRQGDLIYIHRVGGSKRVEREDTIVYDDLYCKIK